MKRQGVQERQGDPVEESNDQGDTFLSEISVAYEGLHSLYLYAHMLSIRHWGAGKAWSD